MVRNSTDALRGVSLHVRRDNDRQAQELMQIPTEPIGSIPRMTADRGIPPFSDDPSPSRETAFARIRARVAGTAMASAMMEHA